MGMPIMYQSIHPNTHLMLMFAVGRFTQLEEPEPEPAVVHRDQVKFRKAKPKPAAELPPMDHVTIEEDRARMAQIQQGPPIEPEPFVSFCDIASWWRRGAPFLMGDSIDHAL